MPEPVRGRGALSNTPNRFESHDYETLEIEHYDETAAPRTRFLKDHSRSILTPNDSPDVGFNVSINPYRGCEHGCIYCYARPTHEYLGMSAGIDFETRILVKENAPELLRQKLMSPAWKPEAINLSGVTDPYQPIERKLGLTRRCLEVLTEFRNPFTIITKNHLVTRDLDLISQMARLRAAAVLISITTLDSELCGILEPRTSRPQARLDAIRELSAAGVPAGVMMAPVIPGLTDPEMPAILKAAAQAGARFAGYVPLRLPLSVLPLFTEWLEARYPDRKEKVLSHIRGMRGGNLNDPRFNSRMRGEGPFAEHLRSMFHVFCRKEGLNRVDLELSIGAFQRPGEQLSLL